MYWLLFLVIVVEALTELAIKSVIFRPLRNKISSWHPWLKELLSCGYCFSVWVAFAAVLILGFVLKLTGNYWIDAFITAVVVHRLSNFLHNFNDKHLDKYYDVRYTNSVKSE